jgi:hypothetical protein
VNTSATAACGPASRPADRRSRRCGV